MDRRKFLASAALATGAAPGAEKLASEGGTPSGGFEIDGGHLFWPEERGAELAGHLRKHWAA